MPASSISGMNSWGMYLIAAVALLVILTPQLTAVAQASRQATDRREAEGLRADLDSLVPGTTINLTFGLESSVDPIRIGGHRLVCDYGTGSFILPSVRPLSNATLYPSVHYVAALEGNLVVVTEAG